MNAVALLAFEGKELTHHGILGDVDNGKDVTRHELLGVEPLLGTIRCNFDFDKREFVR